jgi:2-methylcitrate dehydratase PrpD
MNNLDLIEHFGRATAQTAFEHLPAGAVDAAKKSILDTLGVILAASGMAPAVGPLVELVKEAGGVPESTVLGFGGQVPAAAAAFANGAMAHCLDFDDRTPLGRHCSSSLIPAAFALAQRQRNVSGRRFIAAVAAGQDLFMRMRQHIELDEAWNLSTVLGVLSATAASSSILGLDEQGTVNALGIASTQASGTMQLVHSGSELRGMYAGFSSQAAVTSALLAKRGLPGVAGALEAAEGLFTLCFGDKYDRTKMLDDLGVAYLGANMGYKPWPVVGLAHTYVHATLAVLKEHGLAASDVQHVNVYVGEKQRQLCAPLARKRNPGNGMEAKFSLPYCVALAAVHGDITVSHFSRAALEDPAVRAFAQQVTPIEGATGAPRADAVQVITKDGRSFDRDGTGTPGSPGAPMSWDDIAHKFIACAGAALNPPSAANQQLAINLVRRLDELEDVAGVIRALA